LTHLLGTMMLEWRWIYLFRLGRMVELILWSDHLITVTMRTSTSMILLLSVAKLEEMRNEKEKGRGRCDHIQLVFL
jgi:hypothetical protein